MRQYWLNMSDEAMSPHPASVIRLFGRFSDVSLVKGSGFWFWGLRYGGLWVLVSVFGVWG